MVSKPSPLPELIPYPLGFPIPSLKARVTHRKLFIEIQTDRYINVVLRLPYEPKYLH